MAMPKLFQFTIDGARSMAFTGPVREFPTFLLSLLVTEPGNVEIHTRLACVADCAIVKMWADGEAYSFAHELDCSQPWAGVDEKFARAKKQKQGQKTFMRNDIIHVYTHICRCIPKQDRLNFFMFLFVFYGEFAFLTDMASSLLER